MKKGFIILSIIFSSFSSKATIHVVNVWDGYFQFVDAINWSQDITIQLGDTVQWLPLDIPMMVHTITSTNIPIGAGTFDQIWQAPADTFFQYVPQIAGLYEYECTPHATSHNMIGSINVVDGSTNVNDNFAQEINLITYPNPTSNILSVDGLYSKTKYKIYNLNGELIMTGETDKTIDISALIEGSYIIKFLGDIPRAFKILKQ